METRKEVVKKCAFCQSMFATRYTKQKFCTSKCYGANRRTTDRINEMNSIRIENQLYTAIENEIYLVENGLDDGYLDSDFLIYDIWDNQKVIIGYKNDTQ